MYNFFLNHCCIIDNASKKMLGFGHARDGLYYYNTQDHFTPSIHTYNTNSAQSLSVVSTSNASLNTWHNRLVMP